MSSIGGALGADLGIATIVAFPELAIVAPEIVTGFAWAGSQLFGQLGNWLVAGERYLNANPQILDTALQNLGSLFGGPGGPDVGGVLFDREATVSGVYDAEGAYWDEARQQVILVSGKSDVTYETPVPRLEKDRLFVALRSALAGQPLGVSIDPPKEYRDRHQYRQMPDGVPLLVSYLGNTEGTEFGSVMFEADRLMKNLGVGVDNETREPVIARVPGFRTHLDMMAPGRQGGTYWYRFWFVTDRVELKKSSAGDALAFGEVKIKVLTETQYHSGEKAAASEPTAEQFARHLTEHYDEYARQFPVLQELKEMAKIAALAKYICGSVRSVDARGLLEYAPRKSALLFGLDIPAADLGRKMVSKKLVQAFRDHKLGLSADAGIESRETDAWAVTDKRDSYLIKEEFGRLNVYRMIRTPDTTPGFTQWGRSVQTGNTTHTVGLFGGVDLAADYELTTDDGATGKLRREAEEGRPLDTIALWHFTDAAGGEKKAAAFTIGQLADGYVTSCCDLKLAQAGGVPIEIRRAYNSLNRTEGELGIGWRLSVPYRLKVLPKSGKKEEVLTEFELGTRDEAAPPVFLVNGTTGEYRHYRPVKAAAKAGYETYYPVTSCVSAGKGVSFNYTPADPIKKFADHYEYKAGGLTYHFDLQGRLVYACNARGKRAAYEYEGGLLAAIRGAGGEVISISRGPDGKVKEINASDGTTVMYGYGADGSLALVRDSHGGGYRYYYDSSRLLAETKDLGGHVIRRNCYDDLGRTIGKKEVEVGVGGGETVKKSYDGRHWLKAETDGDGNAASYDYDRNGNLAGVTLSDKADNKMVLTYGPANRLARIADGSGEYFDFRYDSDGKVASVGDSRGNELEIARGKDSVAVKVTDAGGSVWSEITDMSTNKKVITDPQGRSVTVGFNGRRIGSVASGDDAIRRIAVKDGTVIDYFHGNKKRAWIKLNDKQAVAEVSNDGSVVKLDYDDAGLVRAVKDSYGEVCRFSQKKEGDGIVLTAKFQCFAGRRGAKRKGTVADGEKTCPRCNALSPADARFCVECAGPFGGGPAAKCAGCGEDIEAGWDYCPACGKPQRAAR